MSFKSRNSERLLLLTYNFSPVFFQELARAAIEQGAHAINESKLPYAFYGLTYLPLIVGTLVAAAWTKWRGNELFSQPLRQFVIGISSLLLIVAFGHVKALCPVAVLMTAMFAIMTTVLGDRRLSVLSLTAFLVAAAGAVPFANSSWEFELPAESHYLVPLAAAFVLLLIGPWLDRRIRSLPLPGQFLANSKLFQSPTLIFSLAATILTTAAWLLRIGMPTHDMTIWPAAAIGGLLIVHSLVWVRKTLSWVCVAFVLVEGVHCGLEANLTVWSLAQLLTITGLVMWVVTYIFERRPQWRVTRAWAEVGRLSALSQHIALSAIAFMIMTCSEFWFACGRQDERRVWVGLAILTAAFAYFGWFDMLHFGSGISMFLPLVVGGSLSLAATLARRHTQTEILASPFFTVGLRMPLMTVVIAIGRHFMQSDVVVVWRGLNSLALLATSGFYFWHAIERHSKRFVVLSAAILNVALMLLFHELNLSDPQFYLIPIGVSILLLVEVLKREIPTVWHNPLRYAGALVILVSPTFHIIGDSWLPMLSLMISATAVLLVAIGLRVRALMYTGTAFLVADLVTMVVRGGIEHPNLLWITGIGFGAAVLTLGAVLENNREKMLQRLRSISSQLEQWT